MSYISAAQAKQIAQRAVDNLKNGALVPKFAENMTPYSEDSGVTQSVPFINQGTGCANGTAQADTGSFMQLKEKRGNMVCVNQLFPVKSTQTINGITFTSNGDGSYTLNGTATATAGFPLISDSAMIGFHAGRTMLMLPKTEDTNLYLQGYNGSDEFSSGGTFVMPNVTMSYGFFRIRVASGTVCNNVKIHPILVDLTQWFNGNIPAYLLSHPEAFGRYYKGSLAYEPDRLEPATGRYLTSVGRNIWDETWRNGYYDTQSGTYVYQASSICSEGNIKVSPNTPYCLYSGTTVGYFNVFEFDSNGAYIGLRQPANGVSFVTSANCQSITFGMPGLYGTTYNHDITISEYYSGESGYDKYYPYEVLATIDTGTESLYSAGSAYDSKVPSGLITRRIGSVDLGALNWTEYGSGDDFTRYITGGLDVNAKSSGYSICAVLDCARGIFNPTPNTLTIGSGSNAKVSVATSKNQYGSGSAFKAAMSGVMLYYELAEPTTEQGTPFQESVPIDDFGQLSWSNTDVPQGNQIFYPVDYKAYEDTLIKYTDGDATSLALKSYVDSLVGAINTVLDSVNGVVI